ncbi:MAG TPA: methyltransferase [Candidatus Nanopelagicales bacterium]|nr:methyltransferase [Candidatus Nanopelagicales bacterium]
MPTKLPPVPLVRAVRAAVSAAHRLKRAVTPGPLFLADIAFSAYMLSNAILVFTRLGVADVLLGGPRAAGEIARAVEADPMALGRLLRVLSRFGVIDEPAPAVYALNDISRLLVRAPGSLHSVLSVVAEPWHLAMWSRLYDVVKTGRPAHEIVLGKPLFDHFGEDPAAGEVFNRSMVDYSSRTAAALIAAVDLRDARKVIDVGGGYGHALAVVLEAHPHLRGAVAELPSVVPGATAFLAGAGVGDRAEAVPADFFEHVPGGGDVYLLMNVLHDWGDANAERILRACRAAMPGNARLYITDMIVPEDRSPHESLLFDLEMLVLFNEGRERTRAEFERLLASAGFSLVDAMGTALPFSVIEARPLAGAR